MELQKNSTLDTLTHFSNEKEGRLSKKLSIHAELLITTNLRLVHYIAHKYRFPQSEHDDIASVGTIGLIKAAKTFDVRKKVKFATYAAKCINNEILIYYRKNHKDWNNCVYLDTTIRANNNDSSYTLSDIIVDESVDYEIRTINCITLAEHLHRIFNSLDIRSLAIFLADVAGWPQEYSAEKLYTSQSYVSRIAKSVKVKLNHCTQKSGDWDVSYGNDTLLFRRTDQATARFSLDDTLWDNLAKWFFSTSDMPKPRQNITTVVKRSEAKTMASELFRNERAKMFGTYIIEHNATVRGAAKHFNVSKGTIHREITTVLPKASEELFGKVHEILAQNKSERSIRAGNSSKQKYMQIRHEATLKEFQSVMSETFGNDGYKIIDEQVYIWQPVQGWQYFASNLKEAINLAKLGL
jgi:RNA polymerase sporulation-specific sigma factor